MKLTIFLIAISAISVFANKSYSQTVSLNMERVTLKEVLSKIEDKSGCVFMYSEKFVDVTRTVSINVENKKIEDVLNSLFAGIDVQFERKDRLIILTNYANNNTSSIQQQKSVSGKVNDSSGSPLPGVSVVIKGTTTGTITDANGNYTLPNVPENAILQFSFVGMKTQEVSVGRKSTVNVKLEEETVGIEEVVAIGYGTVKKSDLTGSVTSLKSETLDERPASSVDALLQGKIAGLSVTQSSGEPGASVSIRIRGMSSRSGSNSPLYVVDGFPMGDDGNLKQLNPNDIESIEVLKDASAAAIYGSRGANGVILVTTKSGKVNQRPKITLTSQFGVQICNADKFQVIEDPYTYAVIDNERRLLDTRDFVNPLFIGAPDESGFYYPSLTEIKDGIWNKSADWLGLIVRNTIAQNHNFAVSGGSDKNSYSISANYFNQDGIIIGNDYKNYTFRLKFDQKVVDNFKIGTNLSMSYVDGNRTTANSGIGRNPVFPVYNDDGTYYKIGATDFYNPMMLANEITDISDEYNFNGLVYVDWDIVEGLKLKAQTGIILGHSIADYYEPRTTYTGDVYKGVGSISSVTSNQILSDAFLTYNKSLFPKHTITVMTGVSNEIYQGRGSTLRGEGFVNDNLKNELLESANTRYTYNNLYKSVLQSGMARFNYDFDNRLLLTLTGRADGSSKFGNNNKWGFFPSGALAWKLHEEKFMKNLEFVSELKLRTSYGFTGNQAIPIYGSLNQYGMRKYINESSALSGYGPKILGNSGLKWETTSQADFGFDFGLLDQRFVINADYYYKKSTDLLRQKKLPFSTGVDYVWVNEGEILNQGVELSLDADILRGEFQWNVNANIARNINKVIDIGEEGDGDGLKTSGYIESFRDYPTRWRNREPMDIIVGYQVNGIIQTREEGLAADLKGEEALPGEFKYIDQNNDKIIDEKDKIVIGNTQPDFVFGFNTEMKYKGFDLNAQFNGVIGNDIVNLQKMNGIKMLRRWTVDNPTNEWPSLRGGRLNKFSDWWIEDGSFVRISNVTLGYTFDKQKVPFFQNARLYVSGTNLYTFTNYSGVDPEIAGGVNWGAYPKYATYTLGLNLTF